MKYGKFLVLVTVGTNIIINCYSRDPFVFALADNHELMQFDQDDFLSKNKPVVSSKQATVGDKFGEWQVSQITSTMIILKNKQGQIHTISINN